MDDKRFDQLARLVGRGASRRAILKGLLGIGGAAAFEHAVAGDAHARDARTRPVIPAPPPPACSTCGGACCDPGLCKDGHCCENPTDVWCGNRCCESGICTSSGVCCDAGLKVCGSACCSPAASCARDGNADICCDPANGGAPCGLECCADPRQCCDRECCGEGTVCLSRLFGEQNGVAEETCCAVQLACDGGCCDGQCYDPDGQIIDGVDVGDFPDYFDPSAFGAILCCARPNHACEGWDATLCCPEEVACYVNPRTGVPSCGIPTFTLTIDKVEEEGEQPVMLTGACFAIHAGACQNDEAVGDPVVEGCVDGPADAHPGRITFELSAGDYCVVETQAPVQHQLSGPRDVDLIAPVSIQWPNAPLYQMSIYKVDQTGSEPIPLEGACFALYEGACVAGEPAGDELAEGCVTPLSDAQPGSLIFPGLPNGDYCVVETQAPAHYQGTGPLSITMQGHTSVLWPNRPLVQMSIYKVDQTGSEPIPLEGACFALYEGACVAGEPAGAQLAEGCVTPLSDPQPGALFFPDILEGDYCVVETQAPAHYQGTGPLSVTVQGNTSVLWPNTPLYQISIYKVDQTGSEPIPLEGACFALYEGACVAGEPAGAQLAEGCVTPLSDVQPGTLVFPDLLEADYCVVETQAPTDYQATGPLTVTVQGHSSVLWPNKPVPITTEAPTTPPPMCSAQDCVAEYWGDAECWLCDGDECNSGQLTGSACDGNRQCCFGICCAAGQICEGITSGSEVSSAAVGGCCVPTGQACGEFDECCFDQFCDNQCINGTCELVNCPG